MNGYTTIDFNGTTIGLKFGFPAVKEFNVASIGNPAYFGENGELAGFGYAKLLHCAYKNNCLLKEVEPTITLEQFADWVDECEENPERINVLTEVTKIYLESRYTKKLIEAAEKKEETDKKKETE